MQGTQSVEHHEREYDLEGGGHAKLAIWRKSGCHWQAMAQARVDAQFHSSRTRDLGPTGTEAKAWEQAIALAESCLWLCQQDAKAEAERVAALESEAA